MCQGISTELSSAQKALDAGNYDLARQICQQVLAGQVPVHEVDELVALGERLDAVRG